MSVISEYLGGSGPSFFGGPLAFPVSREGFEGRCVLGHYALLSMRSTAAFWDANPLCCFMSFFRR